MKNVYSNNVDYRVLVLTTPVDITENLINNVNINVFCYNEVNLYSLQNHVHSHKHQSEYTQWKDYCFRFYRHGCNTTRDLYNVLYIFLRGKTFFTHRNRSLSKKGEEVQYNLRKL